MTPPKPSWADEEAKKILLGMGMWDNSLECIKDTKIMKEALLKAYSKGLEEGAVIVENYPTFDDSIALMLDKVAQAIRERVKKIKL